MNTINQYLDLINAAKECPASLKIIKKNLCDFKLANLNGGLLKVPVTHRRFIEKELAKNNQKNIIMSRLYRLLNL